MQLIEPLLDLVGVQIDGRCRLRVCPCSCLLVYISTIVGSGVEPGQVCDAQNLLFFLTERLAEDGLEEHEGVQHAYQTLRTELLEHCV